MSKRDERQAKISEADATRVAKVISWPLTVGPVLSADPSRALLEQGIQRVLVGRSEGLIGLPLYVLGASAPISLTWLYQQGYLHAVWQATTFFLRFFF